MAVLLGIVCSIGGVLLTPGMLNLLAVPAEVYGRSAAYTRLYFAGIWSMVLYNMTAGVTFLVLWGRDLRKVLKK